MATALRPGKRLRSSVGQEGETLHIPSKTFVAVAIPGRVNSTATALRLLGGRHAVKSYLASLQAAASPSSSHVVSAPAVALSTPASAASHPVAPTSSGGGLSAIQPVSGTTGATTSSSSHPSPTTTPLLPVTAGHPRTATSGNAATAPGAAAACSASAAAAVSAASASPPAPVPPQSSFLLPSPAGAATEEKLFFRLSVADPVYFKYVASTPTPAAGLLLRVRRRRRSGSSIEILGRVVKHHSFEGLADFYYTPPRRARAALDFRSLLREEEEHGKEEDEERKPLPARHLAAAPEEAGYFSARPRAAAVVEGADSTSPAASAVDIFSPTSSALHSSSSTVRHQILPFIPPPVFCRFTQPAKQNLFDVLFADEPSAASSAPATRGETPGSAASAVCSHTAAVGGSAASGAAAAIHVRLSKDPSRSLPFAGCHAGEVSATAPPVAVALDPAASRPVAPAAAAATSTSAAAVDNSTAFASQYLHRQQQQPKQPRTTKEGEEALKSDYSLSEITVGVTSSTAPLASSVPTLSHPVPSDSLDDTMISGAASATSAADVAIPRAAAAVPVAFRTTGAAAAMLFSPAEASPAAAAVDWGSAAAVAAAVRVPSVLQLPQPHQRTDEQQRQKRMLQQRHVDAGVLQSGADEEEREKAAAFPQTAAPSATGRETEAVGQQQQQEEGGQDKEGEEEAAAEAEVLGLSSRKAGEEFNAVCRYGDPTVPVLPPPAAVRAAADEGLLLLLQQLLQQQPIWLRSSLDALLPATFSAWRRKPAYAKTCFFFADGPWRGCLCRLGYDPRKTPASRFYQTIDMRDPFFRATNWRRLKEKENVSPLAAASLPAAAAKATFLPPPALVKHQQQQQQQQQQQGEEREGEEEMSASAALPLAGDSSSLLQLQQTSSSSAALLLEQRFLRPPSRPSVLYQLKEIQDDVVQKLLQEAPVLPVPCKETGWFPASTMKSLRELLVIKSERMRRAKSK